MLDQISATSDPTLCTCAILNVANFHPLRAAIYILLRVLGSRTTVWIGIRSGGVEARYSSGQSFTEEAEQGAPEVVK